MEEHPDLGFLLGQSTLEMEKAVEYLVKNIEMIRSEKKKRFEYAQKLSWEIERDQVWVYLFSFVPIQLIDLN
jgi:hypothetical protein